MEANVLRWNAGRSAYICVNPGVRAHLQLIYEILRHFQLSEGYEPFTAADDDISKRLISFINPIIDFIKSGSDKEIERRFSRRFGEGGVKMYFYELCELAQKQNSEFGPADFREYQLKQTDERQERTRQEVLDLQQLIVEFVVAKLKEIHGEKSLKSGDPAFWSVGIQDTSIKQEAYRKQQMDPVEQQAPKEAYLELIDCVKIIKQPNNWSHFEQFLSIPLPDERGKKYYLDWLEDLNKLRRIAAHKTDFRKFEENDLLFVDWVKSQIYSRLEHTQFLLDRA